MERTHFLGGLKTLLFAKLLNTVSPTPIPTNPLTGLPQVSVMPMSGGDILAIVVVVTISCIAILVVNHFGSDNYSRNKGIFF